MDLAPAGPLRQCTLAGAAGRATSRGRPMAAAAQPAPAAGSSLPAAPPHETARPRTRQPAGGVARPAPGTVARPAGRWRVLQAHALARAARADQPAGQRTGARHGRRRTGALPALGDVAKGAPVGQRQAAKEERGEDGGAVNGER